MRGGVCFTTLPSIKVPAGRANFEFRSTGSSRRARTGSPGGLLDALTVPRRRILQCVPAGGGGIAGGSGSCYAGLFLAGGVGVFKPQYSYTKVCVVMLL